MATQTAFPNPASFPLMPLSEVIKNPTPDASVPTLSTRAMLASLPISRWQARKHDKKVSEEVATNHHLGDATMGAYNKHLLPKEALKQVDLVVSRAKTEFYKYTLPWADEGSRILPSAAYFELSDKMREFQTQFEAAVADFERQYPVYVQQAQTRLGGLFRLEEYPAPSEIRGKFNFEFKILPLPEAQDFRVNLGEEEAHRVQEAIRQDLEKTMQHAMKDVWGQLRDVVERMANSLRSYQKTEKGTTGVFRDTLVHNVTELLNRIPSLNLTNDEAITQFAEQMRGELTAIDPSKLREDAGTRSEVAAKAEAILAQMSEYI